MKSLIKVLYINKRIIVFPGCSWLSQWLCSSLLPVWHTSQKCFWHTGNWTHIISTIQPNKLSVILSFMTHLTLHDYTEEDFKNLFPFQQDVIIGSFQKILFFSIEADKWAHDITFSKAFIKIFCQLGKQSFMPIFISNVS